jgi:hypothetical protein
MNNLSIQSKTIQADISPSNNNNSFTHIRDVPRKEIQFPNTNQDFGFTHQSKTIDIEIPQEEIWKVIDDYPNYKVSNFGNVYSIINNMIMTHEVTKKGKGYHRVELYKNGKSKHKTVSRLVYQMFGERRSIMKNFQVEHQNRNKDDNHITNLRLSTKSQNEANKIKCKTNYQGNKPSRSFIGVTYRKRSRKWESSIKVKSKSFYLGLFKDQYNCAWVYNQVARQFKEQEFWLNTLPTNFVLPKETENREQIIQDKITEISNWLNQQ